MGHYSSFILRLWVEPRDGLRWGLIQHVATRSKRRFSTMAEMLEFIAEHSNSSDLHGPAFVEGWDPPDVPDIEVTYHTTGDSSDKPEQNGLPGLPTAKSLKEIAAMPGPLHALEPLEILDRHDPQEKVKPHDPADN